MTETASDHAETMTFVRDMNRAAVVQPNSTVSTTVLKAAGARVVVFAFDAGQELTEHTAAVPVLLHVLSGRLSVTASGQTVEMEPGDLVHLPARLPHGVLAHTPTVLQLTLLDSRPSATRA